MDLNDKIDHLVKTLQDDRVKDSTKEDATKELVGIGLKALVRLADAAEKLANK